MPRSGKRPIRRHRVFRPRARRIRKDPRHERECGKDGCHHRRRPDRAGCGGARAWSGASSRSCWSRATAVGHAVAQWGHVRMFSPWRYNVDKASEGLLLRGRAGTAPIPITIRRAPSWWRTTWSRWRPGRGSAAHVRTDARVTSISRAGLDKVKTAGREKAPFEIRYSNGKGPSVLRADAVIDASGTWGTPNPAGANGLEAIGEAEHGRQHRLRHARRARCRTDALCRQDRGRAGRRAFGHRHHHRSCAPQGDGARNRDRLAPARRQPGEVVRRRRQRQAGGARGAGLAVRRHRAPGRRARRDRAFARAMSRRAATDRVRVGAGSACCGRHVDRRRADRGYGIPAGPVVPARAAHRAGPGARMPARRWRR